MANVPTKPENKRVRKPVTAMGVAVKAATLIESLPTEQREAAIKKIQALLA